MSKGGSAILTSEQRLIELYNKDYIDVEAIEDGFKFICKNGFRFKATGKNKYNFDKILKVVETVGKKSWSL